MNQEIIREQILRILYEHQENFPKSKGLLEGQIIDRLGGIDISFALYYLLKKGLIEIFRSHIRITAEGIDEIEKIDKNRLLEMGK